MISEEKETRRKKKINNNAWQLFKYRKFDVKIDGVAIYPHHHVLFVRYYHIDWYGALTIMSWSSLLRERKLVLFLWQYRCLVKLVRDLKSKKKKLNNMVCFFFFFFFSSKNFFSIQILDEKPKSTVTKYRIWEFFLNDLKVSCNFSKSISFRFILENINHHNAHATHRC